MNHPETVLQAVFTDAFIELNTFLIGSFIGFVLMGLMAANRVTEQIKINNELKYEIEKLKGGV